MAKEGPRKGADDFTDAIASEEFFKLPRAEFIVENIKDLAAGEIGKLVVNKRIELADRFCIEVTDNRMSAAGMRQGDHVIVERTPGYHDGDIVVVQLGERVFIRRYYRASRRIRLESQTPERQSMIIDAKTPGFRILGCVVQVIREI